MDEINVKVGRVRDDAKLEEEAAQKVKEEREVAREQRLQAREHAPVEGPREVEQERKRRDRDDRSECLCARTLRLRLFALTNIIRTSQYTNTVLFTG